MASRCKFKRTKTFVNLFRHTIKTVNAEYCILMMIIIIIIIITTENSHVGHCTHISESTNVKVQ